MYSIKVKSAIAAPLGSCFGARNVNTVKGGTLRSELESIEEATDAQLIGDLAKSFAQREAGLEKNGTTRRGKQNYKCRVRLWRGEALCGRQFVENPQWKRREKESTGMIDCLWLEKIPLAGIARVLKLSESCLQGYVNDAYKAVPRQVEVTPR